MRINEIVYQKEKRKKLGKLSSPLQADEAVITGQGQDPAAETVVWLGMENGWGGGDRVLRVPIRCSWPYPERD